MPKPGKERSKMKIAGCLGCEYCHTKGEGAVTTYKAAMGYMGIEDCPLCLIICSLLRLL